MISIDNWTIWQQFPLVNRGDSLTEWPQIFKDQNNEEESDEEPEQGKKAPNAGVVDKRSEELDVDQVCVKIDEGTTCVDIEAIVNLPKEEVERLFGEMSEEQKHALKEALQRKLGSISIMGESSGSTKKDPDPREDNFSMAHLIIISDTPMESVINTLGETQEEMDRMNRRQNALDFFEKVVISK